MSDSENREPSSKASAAFLSFAEIPAQIGVHDDNPVKVSNEFTVAQAIQTYMVMEAKAKAETAELQKRLLMQQFRPCKLYPVLVYHDGLRWVCEYASMKSQLRDYDGTDVTAYGMSPEEAMNNFDRQWTGIMDEDTEDTESEDSEDEDI